MLTEKIMHQCIVTLLGEVRDRPVESIQWKLLTLISATAAQLLVQSVCLALQLL